MEIDGVTIGEGSVYFIAEAGVNHNGDMALAEELIKTAADAGANAVKFQTFTADRLVTERAEKADYARETTDDAESQREMLRRYELSANEHRELQAHCAANDITFLSTPFDPESADLLDEIGVPAVKVGSGELDNRPLLKHIAGFGRPMIVSTGMGTMEEVRDAHGFIVGANSDVEVALLHCTSAYPARMEDVNLRAMCAMAGEFPVPIGYSDHTRAVETPGFAVAAGARIVEKHFTLDRSLPGPDHEASLEPDRLRETVRIAREAAVVRGSDEKRPTPTELENRPVTRKSLHSTAVIEPGDSFMPENTAVKRPADGLPPTELERTLGRTAAVALGPGDPITEECIDE